jgi:hypothetical protein
MDELAVSTFFEKVKIREKKAWTGTVDPLLMA